MPASQDPIITADAPAARARATSRGCRTPPSAQTRTPCSRPAAAHSATAENCGRPTPVIIRVVHIAPGPDTDLDDVGTRRGQVAHPLGGDDVAGGDGHGRSGALHRGPDGAQRVEHLVLVPVRGVDDEHVHPGGEQRLRLDRDVTVDPDGGGGAQPPRGVERRGVDLGAQRPEPGEQAGEPAVGVDSERDPVAAERVEHLAR